MKLFHRFDEMEDANLGYGAEERLNQLRAWIWPLLLARLEARSELEGLLVGSATQPLICDDALAHVLDLPVGSTRSGIAKDGTAGHGAGLGRGGMQQARSIPLSINVVLAIAME